MTAHALRPYWLIRHINPGAVVTQQMLPAFGPNGVIFGNGIESHGKQRKSESDRRDERYVSIKVTSINAEQSSAVADEIQSIL